MSSTTPGKPTRGSSRGRRPQRMRRTDPRRRDRIIDACLEVIASSAVAGTSHRKVAAAADVPLGSMTYHFAGIGELLQAAFARFADSVADQFDRRMAAASDREEAELAVVALITEDVFRTRRDLVLTHELYALAARDPDFRRLTERWMARSRTALERHFEPGTARLLDALIEGLTIHRALAEQDDGEAGEVRGVEDAAARRLEGADERRGEVLLAVRRLTRS